LVAPTGRASAQGRTDLSEFATERDAKFKELAELLATKPDEQLLGQTEFDVRDILHEIGSDAIQTAVNQRLVPGGTAPTITLPVPPNTTPPAK